MRIIQKRAEDWAKLKNKINEEEENIAKIRKRVLEIEADIYKHEMALKETVGEGRRRKLYNTEHGIVFVDWRGRNKETEISLEAVEV